MIRSVFLVALALGCVSAQNRWPMITVNAAGEIVLQSLTRAQAFQITPTAVTTGPASGTTASLTTVTALAAGVSAYDVTAATSFATNHGVALPTVTLGASVTLYQKASTIVSYVIWSQTSNFINADSSQQSFVVEATARRVICTGVSATRWNCVTDFAGGNSALSTGRAITLSTSATTASSTTATLTAANILGGWHVITPVGAAATLTLDTAANIIAAANTASSLTDSYEITIQNAGSESGSATVSLLVTLASSTGITIPSDGVTLYIPPGQYRTYLLYRTGSSTYTLVQKSTYRVAPTTTTSCASALSGSGVLISNGASTASTTLLASTTTSGTLTCAATRFSFLTVSGSNVGPSTFTITNPHALVGQRVDAQFLSATTTATVTPSFGVITCAVYTHQTITCIAQTTSVATALFTILVTIGA